MSMTNDKYTNEDLMNDKVSVKTKILTVEPATTINAMLDVKKPACGRPTSLRMPSAGAMTRPSGCSTQPPK